MVKKLFWVGSAYSTFIDFTGNIGYQYTVMERYQHDVQNDTVWCCCAIQYQKVYWGQ